MKPPKYYHTCLCCGANLDPGERCDCGDDGEITESRAAYTAQLHQEARL